MNRMEIKGSKTKIILMFVLSTIFVVLGIFLVIYPYSFSSIIFKNIIFIQIIGCITILFFGFCTFFLLRNLLYQKNNLILNETGIVDNSSYSSVGIIYWDDITAIKSIDVMSTKFLIINLKNPDKYLMAQKKSKRKLLERTTKLYGTPVAISSNMLNCNFRELEKNILQFYNRYSSNKHK